MTITPVYAGLLTLFFVFLSTRVIAQRRTAHVGLGDGGDRFLLRRLWVHGNFAKYIPLIRLLMGLTELQGTPATVLHSIGIVTIGGRLAHAGGVSREPEIPRLRVAGMVLTFAAIIVGASPTWGWGQALRHCSASPRSRRLRVCAGASRSGCSASSASGR